MTKAVYVGAGLDILPVLLNEDIKEFIYIDSQPKSEFGMLGFLEKRFFRKNFLEQLNTVMHNNNFKQKISETNYLKYFNEDTKQNINYYINTPFPDKLNDKIIEHIRDSNVLICIGHDPDKQILEYMKQPFTFIGSTHTCYQHKKDNYETPEKSSFLELHNNNYKVNRYDLIVDKKYYEYWKHDKINNKIIKNLEIKSFNSLNELEIQRNTIYLDLYD